MKRYTDRNRKRVVEYKVEDRVLLSINNFLNSTFVFLYIFFISLINFSGFTFFSDLKAYP